MEINLTGKKAVISGSSEGIGFAVAEKLAKAGASVLINGRDERNVEKAVDRLKKENPDTEVKGIAADLGQSAGVKKVIEYWPEADILINNLGIFEPKPFFEITDEDWEEYINVNLMSAVRLSRHYTKGMVNNRWGRVIFNASTTGGFHSGEMVHYGATKAGLLGLSRGIAESVAGSGVTANAFLPGPTRTEKTGGSIENLASSYGKSFEEMEEEMFHTSMQTSILKRFVYPEEVANLAVFLASEQASGITGATMRVDGGIVRSIV